MPFRIYRPKKSGEAKQHTTHARRHARDRLDTPSTVQTGGGEQEEDAEPEEGAGAKNTLAADIVVDYSEPEEAVGVNSTLAADAVLDYSV